MECYIINKCNEESLVFIVISGCFSGFLLESFQPQCQGLMVEVGVDVAGEGNLEKKDVIIFLHLVGIGYK